MSHSKPHDAAFKSGMSDVRIAKDFFQHYLPPDVLANVNLDTLTIQNASFAGGEASDILYRVNLNSQQEVAYFYLLVEHQSTPDWWLAFRMIKYCCKIADQHLAQHPGSENLPLIVPVIFYNGECKYPYSTNVFDLFGEQKSVAEDIFLNSFKLVDLNEIENAEIRRHKWAGVMEMVMKEARRRDAKILIEEFLIDLIQPLLDCDAETYLTNMIIYALSQSETKDLNSFLKIIHDALKPNKALQEEIMTVAEQLELLGLKKGWEKGMEKGMEKGLEQGLEQGLERGVEKGKGEMLQAVIHRLYTALHDEQKIADLLQLSVDEVKDFLQKH